MRRNETKIIADLLNSDNEEEIEDFLSSMPDIKPAVVSQEALNNQIVQEKAEKEKEKKEEPKIDDIPISEIKQEEITVQKNGQPRQAGSDIPDGAFIKEMRKKAEGSLYIFGKAVMGRDYLTKELHLPVCNFLQSVPPSRKMLLMPRNHAKTSIVSHCLPPHILIQPKEDNIYFPGLAGCDNRILLAQENAKKAAKNLGVIKATMEGNKVFRSLWPEICWESPKRQASKWNNQEIVIPRNEAYPDASIETVGVGGAIAGSRPTVIIKDDLISNNAMNSDVVMNDAIEWHITSRALMDEYSKDTNLEALEFIIGTRWAVNLLYPEMRTIPRM